METLRQPASQDAALWLAPPSIRGRKTAIKTPLIALATPSQFFIIFILVARGNFPNGKLLLIAYVKLNKFEVLKIEKGSFPKNYFFIKYLA